MQRKGVQAHNISFSHVKETTISSKKTIKSSHSFIEKLRFAKTHQLLDASNTGGTYLLRHSFKHTSERRTSLLPQLLKSFLQPSLRLLRLPPELGHDSFHSGIDILPSTRDPLFWNFISVFSGLWNLHHHGSTPFPPSRNRPKLDPVNSPVWVLVNYLVDVATYGKRTPVRPRAQTRCISAMSSAMILAFRLWTKTCVKGEGGKCEIEREREREQRSSVAVRLRRRQIANRRPDPGPLFSQFHKETRGRFVDQDERA